MIRRTTAWRIIDCLPNCGLGSCEWLISLMTAMAGAVLERWRLLLWHECFESTGLPCWDGDWDLGSKGVDGSWREDEAEGLGEARDSVKASNAEEASWGEDEGPKIRRSLNSVGVIGRIISSFSGSGYNWGRQGGFPLGLIYGRRGSFSMAKVDLWGEDSQNSRELQEQKNGNKKGQNGNQRRRSWGINFKSNGQSGRESGTESESSNGKREVSFVGTQNRNPSTGSKMEETQ